MSNRGTKTLILAALLLCSGMGLGARSMEQGARGRQRVLVLAEQGGQHEAFTKTGLQWLHRQADSLGFDMTEVADCHRLRAGDIGSYDLVVQLNYPPYAWNEAAAQEFEQAVDSGTVAWIGFHHASLLGEFDGYAMWGWFSDFLGGIRFQNYIAEKADGTVIVEAPGHPVMLGVQPTFTVREDEWYTYDKSPRPRVQVLASVDEQTYQPASDIKMGDHPVVWTNPAKPARNVYFQIGHSASLFGNPDFVRMFRNALLWGLNRPMKCYGEASLEAELNVQPQATRRLSLETFLLAVPTSTGRRATGSADDPDYAVYGTCSRQIAPPEHNLEAWNRLSFDVRTDLDAGVAGINVALETRPASGFGAHLVSVQGSEWQHVVYQIEELPRRDVQAIRFYVDIKGRNLSRLDTVHYEIRNLQLERAERTEQTHGWQVAPAGIAYSMSGYLPEGSKTAIVNGSERMPFRLTDCVTHQVVYEGETSLPATTLAEPLAVADFSDFRQEGIYVLKVGTWQTKPFPIGRRALDGTMWKVLNFIGCQRCGEAVDGIHGKCHTDVYCDHEGRSYSYGGGWHDAGDLSQQTLQTGDVAFALLEAGQSCRQTSPQLADLLFREARHGLRQIVNTRMGGGWRASSIGLLHWTDGIAGTADDIHSVRKHHLAFDNYLLAAYEAYAALTLADDSLRRVAVEDFRFADEQFLRSGIDTFRIAMEHTYNTSELTWMAAASWSASMLYRLTGDAAYADKAARYIRLCLDCQEQQGDYAGYFYRDASRRAIVHYIHQSREQLPVQALVALCETQPRHADCDRWKRAVRLYGQYLKKITFATRPYGMLPSGIYRTAEYADQDGFSRLHLWAPDNARELYDRQLRQGLRTDDSHYIRRFPVWFSIFNGGEAVLLSSGKAAALCGRFLHDDALLDIAREQLYWTVGKNPFCQSLIYGEGHRYASQDSFSSGEIVGEIPVGIRSLGNDDVPFFPMTNNACYKEVWLTSAGKWLSLMAELTKP
ncbi:MAG: ThuA domain-containing protein [Bacteroidaceae bacterium]|nr:ThuA domain-containing protein [Bacteroidaceae bacterium]